MKSQIVREFETARSALLDAATAIDANRPEDAVQHLRSLSSHCYILIEIIATVPQDDCLVQAWATTPLASS